MAIVFDPENNQSQRVQLNRIETYMAFRFEIPKPPNEEAHLRHILRYYVSRALLKQDKEFVYVLPEVMVDDQNIMIDVLAQEGDQITLAICEPDSITPETEEILELLRNEQDLEVIVLHSQYGKPGNVEEKFKVEIESNKFRIMAVVPPPFDDVYEYDIWMFETTFRELFRG
jgi:sRNA-binding carbon storage regulator CsrA